MRALTAPPLALAAIVTVAGCSGLIDDPSRVPQPGHGPRPTTSPTPTPSPTEEPTPEQCASATHAIRVPTQRVTRFQYLRIVADALQLQIDISTLVPRTETLAAPYSTYPEANPFGEAAVDAYADTAEAVADSITDRLPACSGGDETACARAYLEPLALRLFRRPPTSTEIDPIVALFTTMRRDFDYREALALAISALLQHPQTLYQVERSTGGDTLTLDQNELVSRMALLYLAGSPDAELLAADLSRADVRETQARRMLSTREGRQAATQYVLEWLMQEGFAATQYPVNVQISLRAEVARLVADALAQPNGMVALLTSRKAFVDETLEQFYGLPNEPKGSDGWRELELAEGTRYGLLTHPLLMSRTAHDNEGSVILRGKFVRELLLCGKMGTPPNGAQSMQPVLPPGSTPRQASDARMALDNCKGCHMLMDPIGLGFSGFDGVGRVIAGADASGNIIGGGEIAGTFNGVGELANKLASSEEAARCFSRQWLRYTFGKTEAVEDACAVKALGDKFLASGKNLEALFVSVASLQELALRRGEAQ